MPLPRISHIKETCLYVNDLERTRHFYHFLLGLPVIGYAEGRHIFFRAGNDVLLCFIPEATENDKSMPPHSGSGQLHLAFECPEQDYIVWKNYLQQHDIAIEKEVHWGNNRHSFYFRDPDGHCLEIIMPGVWE